MGDGWAARELQCLNDQCEALNSLLNVKDMEVETKFKLLESQNQCLDAARAHLMHLERQLNAINMNMVSPSGSPHHHVTPSPPTSPTLWGNGSVNHNRYSNWKQKMPRYQNERYNQNEYGPDGHMVDQWRGIPPDGGYGSMKNYYPPYTESYHQYDSIRYGSGTGMGYH